MNTAIEAALLSRAIEVSVADMPSAELTGDALDFVNTIGMVVETPIPLAEQWLADNPENAVLCPRGHKYSYWTIAQTIEDGRVSRRAARRQKRAEWLERVACGAKKLGGADFGEPYRYRHANRATILESDDAGLDGMVVLHLGPRT
jgi:hypothetical protein